MRWAVRGQDPLATDSLRLPGFLAAVFVIKLIVVMQPHDHPLLLRMVSGGGS